MSNVLDITRAVQADTSVKIIFTGDEARLLNAILWSLAGISPELAHVSDQLDDIYGAPTKEYMHEVVGRIDRV